MPAPIVTLTTDFGTADPYVGMMKGVILGICPRTRIVDLTHEVPPQDVAIAAWTLKDAAPYFPEGTVHLAVVDPGVGSDRRGLALLAQGHFFVGPDNGIFSAVLPADQVVSLTRSQYFLPRVSRTFHGRDVFAPVAARLAGGLPLAKLGPAISDPVRIKLPAPTRQADRIFGEVVVVDRFGNLITNVPETMLPTGRPLRIHISGRAIPGLSAGYADRAPGKLLALIGSSGRLEIAAANASAAKLLSAGRGQKVEVRVARSR